MQTKQLKTDMNQIEKYSKIQIKINSRWETTKMKKRKKKSRIIKKTNKKTTTTKNTATSCIENINIEKYKYEFYV